ncbi:conserved Plasmodium protein, unknown function [Plasmodium knowlesi strain H]|uniref:Uncharacterized protein n=3 Tax=Plasmodium knowlesi TaxID=5850 RepID=A0A5K1V5T9_PLAKH|nr:conserved Plasmodium protein, unknown function [Plasmodium knowlesi strain H]OTN64553.1 Uncharacterized protein PKNOH_S130171400 [Plasmodium knowlesi]CAA9988882.1 conserved Plasmodium protein, unknown function [Plasmodium knowlesi strain H]SBO24720.1 conserved Plasmodium protein, unknown function [Plasmodium knowlesi strain H]SBO27991.1 conserved Plasmodium protein, unknown function [Plasmodium knowlesi strain H]VVS78356.1 conserved Plasmodium protein, unknown function [Plasmodium knowlesi |eukprot:XP_002261229.1 hypothetical protein, conserved in Plasmodium species [Plasmodium knowlesi strain H]
MNTSSDAEKGGIGDPRKEECEKLIKSTTFINGAKTFECSSGMAPVDGIQNSSDGVEIFLSHNKLSDHVKSIMGHVNDYFTKKIKEEKSK